MVNEQQDAESRSSQDGEHFSVGTFTPRVTELLLAQPMNPIRIMTFTKLPRQPKAGKVCPSYNSNNDNVVLAGDTQPSELSISFSQPMAGPTLSLP